MLEPIGTAAAPINRGELDVGETHREVAYITALDSNCSGSQYCIAGFCSKYRDNVSYYAIKDFNQPLSQEVRSQIGGMSGRLATRMGAAIRHATARFEGIESRRRLLLILSDGRPEDYDDGGDRRYLHEDTRMAVKEAVNQGVHPFCITVDTMANQYLLHLPDGTEYGPVDP